MKDKAILISFSIAAVALFVVVFAFAYLFLSIDPNPEDFSNPQAQQAAQTSFAIGTSVAATIEAAQATPVASSLAPTTDVSDEAKGAVFYVMQAGDTFEEIAERFGQDEQDLRSLNQVDDYDWFYVGSIVRIRPESEGILGASYAIVPDAELVNSPNAANFDVQRFITQQQGYLATYQEEIYGVDAEELEEGQTLQMMSGVEIVQTVARDYSINPRLLLAMIDYQTGWLTNPNPPQSTREGQFNLGKSACETFFCQVSWLADRLNWGYYAWKQAQISHLRTADGQLIQLDPRLNAGTVAVQTYFAFLQDATTWQVAVAENGLAATYRSLFGDPFAQGLQETLPAGLTQPAWQLPFEEGVTWVFTGGPHPGWGNGTSMAALDFAPFGGTGCYDSAQWVVAISDGVIVDVDEGLVLVDVDGDGISQTGWTVQYMHIADAKETLQIGTVLQQGDRIGHPSCEGGVSTGTHVHIARLFQGEWIDAGNEIPFVMDGWQAQSVHGKYDGYLTKDDVVLAPYLSGFEVDENYLITR